MTKWKHTFFAASSWQSFLFPRFFFIENDITYILLHVFSGMLGSWGLGVEVEEKGVFSQGHGDPGLRCHCPEKAVMAPKAAPTPGIAWTPPFLSTSPPFHEETHSQYLQNRP